VDAYLDLLNAAGRRVAEVHFFGGEPFFAEEVVRFVVDYTALRAAQLGLDTHFEVITNGFYPAATSQWIADRFDTVILSLDGPADIQERQRPAPNGRATFATIFKNAQTFSNGSAELIIRACVTRETVGRMTATARWLAEELRPSAVCFETLVASPLARASGLFPPSPWEFGRQFLAASHILAEYGIETVLSTVNLQNVQTSFCPVGKDALIVSPDGAVDACYLLPDDWRRSQLDLHFGRVTPRGLELDSAALERIRTLAADTKPLCATCLCRYHCAGGCHVNHPTADNYDDLCIQTRLVTIASLLRRIGQLALAESWLQAPESVLQPTDQLFEKVPL
jgi:radical SAM protein with 4Fe4S-binding SPASM domain